MCFNAPKGGYGFLTELAALEVAVANLSFNAPKGGYGFLTASPGGIIALFCQMPPTGAEKSVREHRPMLKKAPDARIFIHPDPHISG